MGRTCRRITPKPIVRFWTEFPIDPLGSRSYYSHDGLMAGDRGDLIPIPLDQLQHPHWAILDA